MEQLKGTWRLVRLALRRDRIKLSITLVSIGILMPMMVRGIKEIVLEGSVTTHELIALLASNPAMRLFGLPTGGDVGNLLMLRAFMFVAIVVGLVSVFTVIRHTRQNEELGRSELIGSNVVGRHAGLAAALVVSFLANTAIGVLVFFGLMADDLQVSGSLGMAAGFALVGMSFSVIAAVCAQLSKTSRGANSLASMTVGLSFLFAGMASVLGTVEPSGVAVDPMWVIWLTPIGWAQMIYPFAGENWNILWVFGGFFAAGISLALWLTNKRDIGGSILALRAGRARAPKNLLNTIGLTWRLQRGQFIGWATAITLLAAVYAVVAGSIEDLLAQAEGFAEVFVATTGTEDIILAYLGATASIMGVVTLAYTVQSLLRLRAEERRALEFLLSTKTGRLKWSAATAGFALVTAAAILALAGLVGGVIARQVTATPVEDIVAQSVIGGLVQLPAILTIVGVVILTFGILPKLTTPIAWAVVSVSVLFSPFFGSILSLPQWILNLSPLSHTPIAPPLENITLQPILILSTIGLTGIAVGLATFKKRDIDVD